MKNFQTHYAGLDLLRFIAALMVATMHLNISLFSGTGFATFIRQSGAEGVADFSTPVLPSVFIGALGVQIFFVISGFLIAQSATKSANATQFLALRAIRLVPALWICSLAACVVLAVSGYAPWQDALKRLLRSLVVSPIGKHVDDVVWTLTLEVIFYSAVAFFWSSKQSLLKISAGLSISSFLYWMLYEGLSFLHHPAVDIFNHPVVNKITSLGLIQHGAFFAMGISANALMQPIISHRKWHLLILTLAIITSFWQIDWVADYYHRLYMANDPHHVDFNISTWMFLVWSLFLCSFYRLINPHNTNTNTNFKITPYFRYLGLISYPLYLSHNIIGGLLTGFLSNHVNVLFSVFAGLFVAVAWSALVALKLEIPIQKRLKRNLPRLQILKTKFANAFIA
jgi:peptidoglycan/LPS O-acetylase OafA/YrhL